MTFTDVIATTELRALYDAHIGTPSAWQVHPLLMPLMGDPEGLPAGRSELQRQRAMEGFMRVDGRSVLDIGANTGYFSLAAIERGARRVVSQEGDAGHAEFLQSAARLLDVGDRLTVRPGYYDFDEERSEFFDITLCLNVLHHLGGSFGDPAMSLDDARRQMLSGLNRLARTTHTLFLQIGYQWKGLAGQPLFARGSKSEQIDFVSQGTAGIWRIDDIVVASGFSGSFEPINGRNAGRDDSLGEFLNRPLFHMTSLVGR